MTEQKRQDTKLIREKLNALKARPQLQDELDAAVHSPFYLWWQCLKESEEYAAALRGELGEPWAGMAADFGELQTIFHLWWLFRGRGLVGSQVYEPVVQKLYSHDQFVADDLRPTMLLEVPLTIPRKEVIKQFATVLDQELSKRVMPETNPSGIPRTLYPDQRMRRATIEQLLEVWRARKAASGEAWWETGERLGHWPQYHCLPDDPLDVVKRKQRLMSVTVQRLHRMAGALISYAAKGDFPRVK